MRLIDADKQLEWVDCMTPIHDIGLEPVVAVETVRDLIKGAPTVEAIPVEWILNKVGDEETYTLKYRHAWGQLVGLWANEQEAR